VFVDALTSPISKGLPTQGGAIILENPDQNDGDGFRDRSFEMSDGEERSLARLVIELDSRKCDPLPNYDGASPEKAHVNEHAMDSITVDTGAEQEIGRSAKSPSNRSLAWGQSNADETDESQSSVKMFGKKRKRVAEKKQNNGNKRRHYQQMGKEDVGIVMDSQLPLVNKELNDASGVIQGSPDLACDPGDQSSIQPLGLDDVMDPDSAEANLQLITEASQQSEAERHADLGNEDAAESLTPSKTEATARGEGMEKDAELELQPPTQTTTNSAALPVGPSAMERIVASLGDGLHLLQTATLSREEVYKIEDMFMDIKKELYEAERRSRR
jgi:hypothetical protein